MTVIRIEMTEEQFEDLIAFLRGGCPSEVGLPETCGMPTCGECWKASLKPETIPAHKGKEG